MSIAGMGELTFCSSQWAFIHAPYAPLSRVPLALVGLSCSLHLGLDHKDKITMLFK